MNKELCYCNKKAVWWYMPGYSGKKEEHPFYCDEHVPRGCSCNHWCVKERKPEKKDFPVKWFIRSDDNVYWTSIDEKGREDPCCEYDHDNDGYDKDK